MGVRSGLRRELRPVDGSVLEIAVEARRSRAIATQGGNRLVNKSELCTRVADRAVVSREPASSVVTVLLSVIGEALARKETVAIAGFRTSSTRDRPARRGRNPRTGESIAIAATRAPAFKAGKTLRDQVNAKT